MAAKNEPLIHNMIRTIGAQHTEVQGGDLVHTVDEVDQAVGAWLERGYKLQATHYLGAVRGSSLHAPVIGHTVLYVLVRPKSSAQEE